jgi:serine/threonine-protein kinase
MAPEQITGGVDRRADLYSTGVMLWEAVAGQRMWSGKTEFEVLVHVVRDQVPPLRELVPDVPEPLACIIDRAVAKAADDRFPSARALQEALEELLDGDREATTRAVKRTLNELFAEERTKRQLSIQAQLAELRASGSRSASYPRIESQPSLMPVQLGPSVSPAPMPAPSIPVLEPWRPPPASPSWRPPGIPRRALVRATAVAALVALSFFVGFRSKNANAPTRAAAVALDESRPLLPLDPAWPSIGPAPTLTPPPPPPSVAAPAWGFRTGAFVRPRAPVPTASSGPSADVAPPLPAATRPAPASVRIIGDKKTSVLVVE